MRDAKASIQRLSEKVLLSAAEGDEHGRVDESSIYEQNIHRSANMGPSARFGLIHRITSLLELISMRDI